MENNQPSSPVSGLSEDSLTNMSSTLASIMHNDLNAHLEVEETIIDEANDTEECNIETSVDNVDSQSCEVSIVSNISDNEESLNDYGNIYVITLDKGNTNNSRKKIYSWEKIGKKLKIPMD